VGSVSSFGEGFAGRPHVLLPVHASAGSAPTAAGGTLLPLPQQLVQLMLRLASLLAAAYTQHLSLGVAD
jgi:hypothetical protein